MDFLYATVSTYKQNLTSKAVKAPFVPQEVDPVDPKELPVILRIEKTHLSAPVEPVGINALGEMETPQKIANVAWFKYGVRPGQIGSAVINGHYGWKRFEASAFDNLHTLRIGDTVQVVDGNGATLTFVVRKLQRFAWDADPKAVFVSTDGKSHLNLITCEGTWDPEKKTYLDRLVVFTDRVE